VHTINLLMDFAVLIIAIQLFVFLLIPIGLLFFVNKGVGALPKLMRRYAPLVQFRFRQAAEIAEKASQQVVAPFIAAEAFGSKVQRIRRRLF
jgi:hypothetical protein